MSDNLQKRIDKLPIEPRCTRTFSGKHKWETGWTNEWYGREFKYPLPMCGYCGMIDDREVIHDDKT